MNAVNIILRKKREDRIITENQILFALAISKEPLSKYQLEKHVDKTYSNIFETTKKLLKDCWIQVEKTEPNRRNPGQNVEYYRLTKIGILVTLSSPEGASETGTITNNYADMLWKGESALVSLVNRFPREVRTIVTLMLTDKNHT